MISDNETNDCQNNPNNEPDNIPLQSEFKDVSNIPPDQKEENKKEDSVEKKYEWKEYRKEYRWKWIDPLTIFTFFLTIFTFYLYKEASKGGQQAAETLNEYKTEFNIVNEPFLAVDGNIGLSNWKKFDSFSIVTVNLYNMAARTIEFDTCVFGIRHDISDTTNLFLERDSNVVVKTNPGYTWSKYPKEIKFDTRLRNTREYTNDIQNNINTFFGVIFYKNYLTNKRKYYIFSARIKCDSIPSGWHRIDDLYVTRNQDTLPASYYKCKFFPR